MPVIKPILVSECQTHKKVLDVFFEDTEWATLKQYHEEAEALRATRFVQEGQGGSINITLKRNSAVSSKAKTVDFEALSAMLHRARPFLLSDERTYFFKTLNIMKRRTRHSATFSQQLEAIRDQFNLKRMKNFSKIGGGLGGIATAPSEVMDWLNAHQYHRNEDKRVRLETKLGVFGQDQNGAPVVLFALVDMIQAVLNLSDSIENLILASKQEFEITCPINLM